MIKIEGCFLKFRAHMNAREYHMADGVERIHGYVLSALQQAGFDEVGVQGRSGPDHAGADVFLSSKFYDENFESADICAT